GGLACRRPQVCRPAPKRVAIPPATRYALPASSNAPTSECFPADEPISRSGLKDVAQPRWPDPSYPKTATGMVLGSVFCVSPTGGFIHADTQTGPGALILPVERLTVYGSP